MIVVKEEALKAEALNSSRGESFCDKETFQLPPRGEKEPGIQKGTEIRGANRKSCNSEREESHLIPRTIYIRQESLGYSAVTIFYGLSQRRFFFIHTLIHHKFVPQRAQSIVTVSDSD